MLGGLWAVRHASSWAGAALSRRLIPGDPLGKRVLRHKFMDQMWQLVAHASMAALEIYILLGPRSEGWLSDSESLGEDIFAGL